MINAKQEIKNLLKKYNLSPKKYMGQNFLINKNALKKIIEASDLSCDDTVLEIGPGLGILTLELTKHAKKIIAIEKDKELAETLQKIIKEKKINNAEIIYGDIIEKLKNSELRINELTNYKIVANIPYYLTSHLIRLLLELKNKPQLIILMIQKEVAQRIVANPPKMTLLSVSVQYYAKPKIVSRIKKDSFWPRPKIDSAIIKIAPKKEMPSIDSDKFFKIIKAGFSAPRKQLINNLSKGLQIERSKAEQILKKSNINPKQRAESLKIKDWLKILNSINN